MMRLRLLPLILLLLAQPLPAAPDDETRAAIRACRDVVRAHQLPDGAFRYTTKDDAVRIVPYFGNVAAKALLVAHRLEPDDADLHRVQRWIDWYAAHMRPDGTILDHLGSVGAYEPSNKRDAIDTYAPTLLTVIRRYAQVAPADAQAKLLPLARRSLDGVESTIDPTDGLAWSSATRTTKYPMDNLEVCLGLDDGLRYFTEAKSPNDAVRAARVMGRCRAALVQFWLPEKGYFAWAKGKHRMSESFVNGYPDGIVNVFAAGHVHPPRKELWDNLQRVFADHDRIAPDQWLLAARRTAARAETIERYRRAALAAATRDPASLDLERASRLLLALAGEAAEPTFVPLDLPR